MSTPLKTTMTLEELVVELDTIQAVKFGVFTLKSGITSPVYFDLRVLVSYPALLKEVSRHLWNAVCLHAPSQVCGVPYTALPFATYISIKKNIPMLIRRKEAKAYGTKKLIEGNIIDKECLVVEDVVTSGGSVLETVEALKTVGVEVREAVVLLDREQGGKERLAREGINLHTICTMRQLARILKDKGKISPEMEMQIRNFVEGNQLDIPPAPEKPLEERADICQNDIGKKLFGIMMKKKTNVMASVDLVDSKAILDLVEAVGPHVAAVKTHMDIVKDFTADLPKELRELANKHNFVLMEDRKFGDIGNTVLLQYGQGLYRIADWADLVTVHSVPGPGVLEGLKKVQSSRPLAAVLVAEMSSKGNLTKGDYVDSTVKMAEVHRDSVVGLVCQSRLTSDPGLILMTPGVKLAAGSDTLGQVYNTPEEAVKRGADIIIVGRGITEATDPRAEALKYQIAGFAAYKKRLEQDPETSVAQHS